jgi:hypothetical protein
MNIQTLYRHYAQNPESAWIMRYDNALDLYKFIKENNIKRVLSLGTGVGYSDAVIALAWKDKGVEDGIIDSMEQYDKCIKLANEMIPEELKKYINIIKEEVTLWVSKEIPYQYFSVYKSLPDKEYDLIVNDGPAPFLDEQGNYVELPNGTIHKLTLEEKIKPGTFVIYDGRVSSLNLLERYFDTCYCVVKVPSPGSDFFLLERLNSPAKAIDTRYEAMKKQTLYFENHEQSKE